MKKIIIALFLLTISFSLHISAQVRTNILVRIVKAEDERRYDTVLENLMKNPDAKIRTRAALAAGRIGNDAAVPALITLLEKDPQTEVRAMAAFALGEIESLRAADAILKVLSETKNHGEVRARAVEAAGKIAAANAKDEKSKDLGKAIVDNLEFENTRGKAQSREVVLFGLTAVLRARPEKGDSAAAKFLTSPDARIRIDAANTLTRLRAKNANEALRSMLRSDTDAVARANAARALGAAEDKDSLKLLLEAAVADTDPRVRVSAIRAVAGLKDKQAATKLLERGELLFSGIKMSPAGRSNPAGFPAEKSELLEIATAVSRLLPASGDERAVRFLNDARRIDNYTSAETETALARVAPKMYVDSISQFGDSLFAEDWRLVSAVFQGLGEIAGLEGNDEIKSRTRVLLIQLISNWLTSDPKSKTTASVRLAVPELLRAFAAFKSENTSGIYRPILEDEPDLFIRAAVAEILGDQPPNEENRIALKRAFIKSLEQDKEANDAQLAILTALVKGYKEKEMSSLMRALESPDFLVRMQAISLIKQNYDYPKEWTNLPSIIKTVGTVKLYNPKSKTKLGQILNTNADYTRAVSRRNGSVKAVFTTEKGVFTIDLAPEDAPLTVDNFIKLARAGYFNGLAVHRVVPNFVMQDGDPRGDGNGGPGWSIRCEINMLAYERGAVGMALSGKDTGGSQWFVTHSPQPHLDGGYTVFGRVNESEMKVVDAIVRGDRILSVKIAEGKSPAKSGKK